MLEKRVAQLTGRNLGRQGQESGGADLRDLAALRRVGLVQSRARDIHQDRGQSDCQERFSLRELRFPVIMTP